MSKHRHPCTAPAPTITGLTQTDHAHACIHDATPTHGQLTEHRCGCGMRWQAITPPAPVDLTWVTTEPHSGTPRTRDWVIFIASLVIAGAGFAVGVIGLLR